jgi:hypothetical protein
MAGVEILSPGVRHFLEQPPGTNADGVIVERHRVSMANRGGHRRTNRAGMVRRPTSTKAKGPSQGCWRALGRR